MPNPSFHRSLALCVAFTVATAAGVSAQTISQANWTLQSVDSQETEVCCYVATNAFDGNPSTMWVTRWFSAAPSLPHEIQINLGALYQITGFRYLPRQDGAPHGNIGQYEFYVSTDGVTWGSAVASGTFVNSGTEKQVTFAAETGRYVRLRALTEVNGQPWTAVAELNVVGTPTQPPGSIPRTSWTLHSVDSQETQVCCYLATNVFDSNANTMWATRWSSAPTPSPHDIQINLGAVYSVNGFRYLPRQDGDPNGNIAQFEFYVSMDGTDWGAAVASGTFANSATEKQVTFAAKTGQFVRLRALSEVNGAPWTTIAELNVLGGSGGAAPATFISQSGWSVQFVDAEETFQPGYLATNVIDGNPFTSWGTPWYQVPGIPPPHEIQIDMGVTYNVTGFRYLPHQAWQPGRVSDYEFYVSTDGVNWGTPVAAGAFPDTNSATARDVIFLPKTGQYVRFRALGELHSRYLTFLAELNVWQAGTGANQPPVASIVWPTQNIIVRAGNAVYLQGSASDPDGHLPLTYRWSVGIGSGVPDQLSLTPAFVHFDRVGTFPVTLTVTDGLGATSTATRTVTVIGGQSLAKAGWALRFVDSQETGAGNFATNAFDGNPNTFWATQWQAAQPPPPHEIEIDLGAARDVVGFRYLPRQDGSTVGNIGRYEFYVSSDGTNWGAAVAIGIFSPDSSEKEVAFPLKPGRYVKLRALSEVNELPYTAVAELGVLQRQCVTPSVLLNRPRSGYIQRSSTLSLVADACLSAGQGVRFAVDGVTLATDYTAPYSVNAPALSAAEHYIDAFLVDGSGNFVAGAATYDRSIPVGIGDTYVAMGDGITYGLGDDLPWDDNTADGRNLLGGFESVLADGLTAARGYPVSVVNQGVPGGSAFKGAASINQVLQNFPTANFFILMYGHNDVSAGRPSGYGLVPGNPGYAGSFKDYMQRMITAIRNAGKVPLLARHTAVIPLDGPMDTAIQEYNLVIDELAADVNNGIPVAPPDFYTYFRDRTTTHYINPVEPNGLGYQDMGQLWRQAIAP